MVSSWAGNKKHIVHGLKSKETFQEQSKRRRNGMGQSFWWHGRSRWGVKCHKVKLMLLIMSKAVSDYPLMTTMALGGAEPRFKSLCLATCLLLLPVLSSVICVNPSFCSYKIETVKILLGNDLEDVEFINRARERRGGLDSCESTDFTWGNIRDRQKVSRNYKEQIT